MFGRLFYLFLLHNYRTSNILPQYTD